jgi:hypothetical protein
MRIKKPPNACLKTPEKGKNFSLKSKKDFQIRTFRTRKKEQHRRDKLEQRNNKNKWYEQSAQTHWL